MNRREFTAAALAAALGARMQAARAQGSGKVFQIGLLANSIPVADVNIHAAHVR